MASGYNLPAPQALDLQEANVAEKWKKFQIAWDNYSLATELGKKEQKVQVTTLLTIIGEEARDLFSTFTSVTWADKGDKSKSKPVLGKFSASCQPRKSIPLELFKFNQRRQHPGKSYDQYRTALRKLAEGCEFNGITPDELLRDRIGFGIGDSKVRERLLREATLTLEKTDEICASECMAAQIKEGRTLRRGRE